MSHKKKNFKKKDTLLSSDPCLVVLYFVLFILCVWLFFKGGGIVQMSYISLTNVNILKTNIDIDVCFTLEKIFVKKNKL